MSMRRFGKIVLDRLIIHQQHLYLETAKLGNGIDFINKNTLNIHSKLVDF